MAQFVDVPGLEWLFSVSRDGRVLRKARDTSGGALENRELKIRDLNMGAGNTMRGVRVTVDGKRREFSLRALLRRTFPDLVPAAKSKEPPAPHEDRILPQGESRPARGFPGYMVYENGAVCGPYGRPLMQKRAGRYRAAVLRAADGKARELRTGRIVLEAFVGARPEGMVVCHGLRGSLDDSIGNLRWDTPANNDADRVAMGKLRKLGLL